MAYSYIDYTGKGPGDTLVTPPYIKRDDIRVLIGDVVQTSWSWVGANNVLLGADIPTSSTVRVRRYTDRSRPLSLMSPTGTFDYKGADKNWLRNRYVIEEIEDEHPEILVAVAEALAAIPIVQAAKEQVEEDRGHIEDILADIITLKTARDEAVAAAAQATGAVTGAFGIGLYLVQTRTLLNYCYLNSIAVPRREVMFAVDDLIGGLIDIDAWDHIEALNLLRIPETPVALLNIKDPTKYALTAAGGIVHTPGVGFKGDGVSAHLAYSVTPAQVTGWTRYSGGFGCESTEAIGGGNRMATTGGAATPGFGLTPWNGTTAMNCRFNNTTLAAFTGQTDGEGISWCLRTDDSHLYAGKDAVSFGFSSQATQVDLNAASQITLLRSGSVYETGWAHASFLVKGTMGADKMALMAGLIANFGSRIGV